MSYYGGSNYYGGSPYYGGADPPANYSEIAAAVQNNACQAGRDGKCLVPNQRNTQLFLAAFLMVLMIIGVVLLAVYWKKIHAVGIWLPIVLIIVLAIIFIVAIYGVLGSKCALYGKRAP
jgi:hypothetical protein